MLKMGGSVSFDGDDWYLSLSCDIPDCRYQESLRISRTLELQSVTADEMQARALCSFFERGWVQQEQTRKGRYYTCPLHSQDPASRSTILKLAAVQTPDHDEYRMLKIKQEHEAQRLRIAQDCSGFQRQLLLQHAQESWASLPPDRPSDIRSSGSPQYATSDKGRQTPTMFNGSTWDRHRSSTRTQVDQYQQYYAMQVLERALPRLTLVNSFPSTVVGQLKPTLAPITPSHPGQGMVRGYSWSHPVGNHPGYRSIDVHDQTPALPAAETFPAQALTVEATGDPILLG